MEVNWNQFKVHWNQLEVNSNQFKINWNQLNWNWNQFKVNWNHFKVNWNQLKVNRNQFKVNWNQLKVNWNKLKVNWNQLKVNWNQFKVNWNQVKVIWNKLKSIESKLKSIEIYHFFDSTLLHARSLAFCTLLCIQNLFGERGGPPCTNQYPTLYIYIYIYIYRLSFFVPPLTLTQTVRNVKCRLYAEMIRNRCFACIAAWRNMLPRIPASKFVKQPWLFIWGAETRQLIFSFGTDHVNMSIDI